jgi:bifunctional oligoribonuclease and PAP phosphatase NrnA
MIKETIEAINKGQSFLITAHVRLDGDALGSELALYLMLNGLGKRAVVYNQDSTPAHYLFLPMADKIVREPGDIDDYDVAFILDCSELERIGREAEKIGRIKKLVNIDHHFSNDGFSPIRFLDSKASSTGELLFRLMQEMQVPLTKDICTNLYTAILTDTGGFRYSNTRYNALWAAGKLVENGADPQWISENIYENDPPEKLKLLVKAMESLSIDLDRRVSSLVVTRADMQETGTSVEHTDGFVDIPRSVRGIDISILYTEMEENYFKLSLRSKGEVNVEILARKFGGGGHINAAACRIEGNIETVKMKVMAAIKENNSR